MSVINILSPHVADMIAAGEVVERPASVIKELVENSFDAGARNVTVEIRGGGATYIRVTDDGCGMSEEDAGVAFLRHATSKLQDERGLEAISTMGFRGEALAAISSVSRIELRTRRPEDSNGTYVHLIAGEIKEICAAGCPAGTTMIITDLFYNTPARLKFLKSDRSEASACQAAALRCALARPDISVRFIRDGEELFFSPGDGRAESCVYTLLGREFAASMLPCSGEDNGLKVTGFVSSPAAGRGNRGQQYFFCNNRFIRSQHLQAALEQAYRNTLLTGRYPACLLYIELPYGRVDVNVHPAKTEVKFSDEKAVFDLIYYAACSALQAEKAVDVAAEPQPAAKAAAQRTVAEPRKDFFRSMPASEYRAAAEKAVSPSGRTVPAPPPLFRDQAAAESPAARPRTAPAASEVQPAPASPHIADMPAGVPAASAASLHTPTVSYSPAVKNDETDTIRSVEAAEQPKIVEKPVQNVEKPMLPEYRLVGEAMKTYILVEAGDELILIDKHAAHERMIFDRLKTQSRSVMAQSLLIPVTVRISDADRELLERYGELLEELGFEIEPYGASDVIVRTLPADMDSADIPGALEEICDKLRAGNIPDPAAARDEILHTVACKAAIKAGWNTTPAELNRIAEAVLSGRVKYCPHGRPVSYTLTRADLDKLFKRIV